MADDARALRRHFFGVLLLDLRVTWPILSALIAVKLGLGVFVGLLEGWGGWQGIYFACITGLTIGYGDLVPTRAGTRVLAVAIGICGIVFTGIIVALAVRALQYTASAMPSDAAGPRELGSDRDGEDR